MDEIKLDIEEQITKTNKAFTNYWGRLFYDGLLDEDIESLEILLKKATKQFKGYRFVSIVISAILFTAMLLAIFNVWKFGSIKMNINLLAIFTFLSSMIRSLYSFYKIKVNLEHKIFLLGILEKIEKKTD